MNDTLQNPSVTRVQLQPMVHVQNMAQALEFYEALGGKVLFESRDQDWVLLDFGGTKMGLLAHAPGDGKKETVELQFTSERPLEEVEAQVRDVNEALIDRGVSDEAFGRMLKLRTPDGLLVKIVEIEPDLVR